MYVFLIISSYPCTYYPAHIDGKFWDFTSNLAKGDTAYTTLALAAHTDNTYFVRLCSEFHSLLQLMLF